MASITVHVAATSSANPTGSLPVVTIAELATSRHNSNARLELFGSVSVLTPYNITLPGNATYLVQQATIARDASYSWSSPQLSLDNATQARTDLTLTLALALALTLTLTSS